MLGLARYVIEQGHGFFHGAVGALCQQRGQVQHAVIHSEFGLVKLNRKLVAVDRFGAADGAAQVLGVGEHGVEDAFVGGRSLVLEEAVKGEIEKMVADLNLRAIERGVEISIFFAPSSYKGGIFSGPVEYLDFKNPAIMNLEIDYNTQALAFDYFFNALKNQSNIERVNVGNFAWDDALDPEVKPRISVSAGFRNKPAEKVINAWYNFSQEQ